MSIEREDTARTSMVIHGWGVREYDVRMDKYEGRIFEHEKRSANFMGALNRDYIAINDMLKEDEVNKRYIGDFIITTYFGFSDFLLSILPFYSKRLKTERLKLEIPVRLLLRGYDARNVTSSR